MIELYDKMDKSLNDYQFTINYNDIDINNNKCIVDLNLDITLTYQRGSDKEYTTNDTIKHYIILNKHKSDWSIIKDVYNPLEGPDRKAVSDDNYNNKLYSGLKEAYKSIDKKALSVKKWVKKSKKISENIQSNEDIRIQYEPTPGAYRAIQYARRYYENYNTKYPEFNNDCTNFVSQCLHAGNIPMSRPSWYCFNEDDYSTSWIRTVELYDYLTDDKGFSSRSYDGYNVTEINDDTRPGDVIQFYNALKSRYAHTVIASKIDSEDGVLYCGHTSNRKDKPLIDAFDSTWYYTQLRLIEIEYPDGM
ncbi:amidase domain-containing protein [Dethiothermospora halolimnae]|uniref:amidase domain-containing protein n=1 Tax=Dethiothermospora halolimnae TaxID=3114390 RepID=UPI003CCBDB97